MEKIIELKKIYKKLNELQITNENIRKQFIASITDFNILRSIENSRNEEIAMNYSEEEIIHCINSIESFINGEEKRDKLDFSLKAIDQINDLMHGEKVNNHELLQALYMSIFARYNDDIKIDENYHVTPEFANLVYRFDGEELPEKLKNIKSSEDDMGIVFMTKEKYNELLESFQQEYTSDNDRKMALKTKLVTYVLSNIRNRMMHGDYENTIDSEGNSIVKISPCNFKAKFFFDCILEFYEAISEEIKKRTNKKDNLFDLENILLEKPKANLELLDDKDKLMSIVLPLYINSFITYNFNDSKKDIQKLRKEVKDNSDKTKFLDLYYKSKDTNSFIYKVANYNKDKNYTAYDIINHFRNSVVHNNYRCDKGIIHIKDFDQQGNETANFEIPYEMIEELIVNQSEQAKKILGSSSSSKILEEREREEDEIKSTVTEKKHLIGEISEMEQQLQALQAQETKLKALINNEPKHNSLEKNN